MPFSGNMSAMGIVILSLNKEGFNGKPENQFNRR